MRDTVARTHRLAAERVPPDVGALLAVLEDYEVEFVLVGSVAVEAWGTNEGTPGDLDIVPAMDRDNLTRLAGALGSLGARTRPRTGEWQTSGGEATWLEYPQGDPRRSQPPASPDPGDESTFDTLFATIHGELDVVPSLCGTYEDLLAGCATLTVHGVAGVQVIGIADLLTGMTVPRRPKNVARVAALRRRQRELQDIGPHTIEFGHLRIAYDDRVLQPRSWTVDQSRWAAEVLSTSPAGPALELCCGAGQIGLLATALTPEPARRQLVAVDNNPAAVAFTMTNADAAGLADWVQVRGGDMGQVLGPEETYSVIIADPPWVPRDQTRRFPEDPLSAIDGGADGLAVARQCLEVIQAHLAPDGVAVLQLGTIEQVSELDPASYGLRVSEVRTGARGVLVHLSPDPSSTRYTRAHRTTATLASW